MLCYFCATEIDDNEKEFKVNLGQVGADVVVCEECWFDYCEAADQIIEGFC